MFITFRKPKPKEKSFELKIIAQMGDNRTLGVKTRSESLGLDQRAFLGVQVLQ